MDKSDVASLKEKLIEKIKAIDDHEVLEKIEDGIFKAIYGGDSASQIREFLNKNNSYAIEKGTSNKGKFSYEGRTITYQLEGLYHTIGKLKVAIECDDEFHTKEMYYPIPEMLREGIYFSGQSCNVVVRYGYSKRNSKDSVEEFIKKKSETLHTLLEEVAKGGDVTKIMTEMAPVIVFFGYITEGENKHIKAHKDCFETKEMKFAGKVLLFCKYSHEKIIEHYNVKQ
jgi:hypothetical protein